MEINLKAETELQRLFLKDLFWKDSPENKFSYPETKGAFIRLEQEYPSYLKKIVEQGGLIVYGSEDSKIIRAINMLILEEIEKAEGERRNE